MTFLSMFRMVFWIGLLRLNFGSGGGSSQQSATTTNNTTQVSDNRTVADGGAVVAGAGATVNTTDLGSVQRASELAEQAIVGATKLATDANTQAGALVTKSLDMSKETIAQLQGAYEASGKATLFMAAAVGLVLWVVNSSSKGKK